MILYDKANKHLTLSTTDATVTDNMIWLLGKTLILTLSMSFTLLFTFYRYNILFTIARKPGSGHPTKINRFVMQS